MSDDHLVPAKVEQVNVPDVTHPLASAALEVLRGSPTPEALEKILELQERYEEREAKKAFTRAMTALKRDLPRVLHKDKLVDFESRKTGTRTRYKHTTLAHAVDELIPHLTNHGFSHSWVACTTQQGKVSVVCKITHSEGHSEESPPLVADPDTRGLKSSAQAVASTVTTLQRYSLLAALGIATKDMDEDTPQESAGQTLTTKQRMQLLKVLKANGHDAEAAVKVAGKPVDSWSPDDVTKIKSELLPAIDMETAQSSIADAPDTKELGKVGEWLSGHYMTEEQNAELIGQYQDRWKELENGQG